MLQTLVHYFLHLIFPGIIAWFFFRSQWRRAYLILLATMLVDLDHFLATPVFDPCRCSIGFHPLHSYWACAVYMIGLFFRKTHLPALGLVLHMITDAIDCYWSSFSDC